MKKGELFEAALALLFLLLAFTLCMAVLSGRGVSEQWAISGPVAHTGFWVYDNMYAPGNGLLYTIDGASIYAIDQGGNVRWALPIPDPSGINAKNEKWTGMAAAVDGDAFYVIVGPGNQPARGELLSIYANGSTRWIAPLTFNFGTEYQNSPPGLYVYGDRIYIHHYRNQILLTANGSLICNLYGVYEPAIVDAQGNMYLYSGDNGSFEAYSRDGTLLWRHDASYYNVSVLTSSIIEQPYFRNGILYVWLTNGVMALDRSGNKLWVKKYGDGLTFVDKDTLFDGQGNLYLRHYNYVEGENSEIEENLNNSYISLIQPDGREISSPMRNVSYLQGIVGVSDGIYYHAERVVPAGVNDTLNADRYKDPYTVQYDLVNSPGQLNNMRPIDKLDTYAIQAIDLATGRELWSTTLPLFPVNVTLDASNLQSFMPPYLDTSYALQENQAGPIKWYRDNGVPNGTEVVGSWGDLQLMPAQNITFLSLWTINYEVPTFYGRSQGAYSGGVYALDPGGNILWAKPTGSRVTDMKVANGTVYYGTDDGKLSATRVNLAAGFALTAAFYLFFRFLMAGAITRARGRVDGNENRNFVLKFIVDNPGSSLYDISRGLHINLGTVRYHLLILGVNHRVVSFRSDGKHVRYFTNSGSYKAEEQSLISLMRRDAIRKALLVLLKNPGLSNRELSLELNMLDSATNRYMKELIERGIVENDGNAEGRTSYVITNEYRDRITVLMERLNGPSTT